jgi:hypothetical protein
MNKFMNLLLVVYVGSLANAASATPPTPPTPKSVLLANTWTVFYSTEPDLSLRATIDVSFPNATTMNFTKTCLFSELGLGDDVVITLASSVTVDDAYFSVPTSQSKTVKNAQGAACSVILSALDYGFSMQWGNRVMSFFHRDFNIKDHAPNHDSNSN